MSRLFLDHGTRVEVSRTTFLVSKCLETGAEVSQSVLMPKWLVAEVSGNRTKPKKKIFIWLKKKLLHRCLLDVNFCSMGRTSTCKLCYAIKRSREIMCVSDTTPISAYRLRRGLALFRSRLNALQSQSRRYWLRLCPVHTADTTQLDSLLANLFRLVETVANWLRRIPYTPPTRLNSTVASRRRRILASFGVGENKQRVLVARRPLSLCLNRHATRAATRCVPGPPTNNRHHPQSAETLPVGTRNANSLYVAHATLNRVLFAGVYAWKWG